MRVLFWGTPEFACPPLRALLGEGFDVVGVVTQPDKPQGRSRSVLVPPPVKVIAEAEGIQVFQPAKPRGEEFYASLRALEPDLNVVVAYGHILKREVIEMPPLGTWNIHASLLPLLRGAAPIQAAIRDGFRETGVTVMQMVEALDAGPVLLQRSVPIDDTETYGELQTRLSEVGAAALIEALALHEAGVLEALPQDDALATYAGKITREGAWIEWDQPAEVVAREIRGYDPKPGAWTRLRGVETRLFGARVVPGRSGAPGEVLEIGRNGMVIGTGAGAVLVLVMQPAGKKRMAPSEVAAGRGVVVGEVLGGGG
jgi:methionyl-tRNA formyltransferase